MNHDVGTYVAGKPAPAVELFHVFRGLMLAAGQCELIEAHDTVGPGPR
ncbi:hypothetical protein M2428_001705 [Arthrobacter sp. ES3-54]|nr:hypothetical protein [Arthrobacter sp. ES3-54]